MGVGANYFSGMAYSTLKGQESKSNPRMSSCHLMALQNLANNYSGTQKARLGENKSRRIRS